MPKNDSDPVYSAAELANAVNQWCDAHRVTPVSGQVGEALNERNIRYYRSIGLLAAPRAGRGKGFGELQLQQLLAVRSLQAKGLPLRRIQELLFGKSERDLRELVDRWLSEQEEASAVVAPVADAETWNALKLNDDFLLIARNGKQLPPEILTKIRNLIQST